MKNYLLKRLLVAVPSLVIASVIVFMALAGKRVLFVVFIELVGFFLYAMRPVLQAWAD